MLKIELNDKHDKHDKCYIEACGTYDDIAAEMVAVIHEIYGMIGEPRSKEGFRRIIEHCVRSGKAFDI